MGYDPCVDADARNKVHALELANLPKTEVGGIVFRWYWELDHAYMSDDGRCVVRNRAYAGYRPDYIVGIDGVALMTKHSPARRRVFRSEKAAMKVAVRTAYQARAS